MVRLSRLQHTSLAAPAIGGLAICLYVALTWTPAIAHAEPYATSTAESASQYGIEALSATYEEAQQKAAEATSAAEEGQAKVTRLESEIATQRTRVSRAMREMYIMEQNRLTLLDILLASRSLDDAIKYSDYIEHVSKANANKLDSMEGLLSELEATRDALEQKRQEAEAQEALAQEALVALQNSRAAKQRSEGATDGADWYMTEDEFIAEWAPRIDAYYVGTPMAGTGEAFARASWLYCIDPRWSPAISTIESSKGAHCIRPHNAWGWGAADSDPYKLASEWSSWDEAINAHVSALARGYGYTVSLGKAQAYCPNNAEHWYETVVSEMAKI